LSKTCFYCGKELSSTERCDCRNPYSASAGNPSPASAAGSGADSSKSSRQSRAEKQAQKEHERQTKERAKEDARRFRQARRTAGPVPGSGPVTGSGWRQALARLMSSSAYSETDSFPKKIGFSLLQTILRPVTAIETFVQRHDIALSVFYMVLFSFAVGFLSLRFFDKTIVTFLEGTVLGGLVALLLNGMFLLVFRFFSKIRLRMDRMLSSFSASALFMAVFFMIAAASGNTLISFLLTMLSGIVAGTLLHFIALKVQTHLPSDQLVVHVIFVYVLFFSMLGVLINLLIPATTSV
jgi:hypothetical protein